MIYEFNIYDKTGGGEGGGSPRVQTDSHDNLVKTSTMYTQEQNRCGDRLLLIYVSYYTII